MPTTAWLALAFCVVAILGAGTILVVSALRAWRTFGSVGRTSGDALAAVLDSASAAEARALALSGGTERLSAAIARLQQSLAELAAIRAAFSEAQGLLGRLRGVVPRK